MRTLTCYCLSLLGLCTCLHGQALLKHPEASPYALNYLIPDLMKRADIPGFQIALVQRREVLYSRVFGVNAADARPQVEVSTIFSAASLSKPLFAYGVLQLVEDGLLDLDRPLAEYWEYPDLSHDPRYREVTARMVLSHKSGLPNWRRGPLNFQREPGKAFGYSGEGYVFLMKTVEAITGQPLEAWMQEKVLRPLGMDHSSYIWQDRFDSNHALPHDDMAMVKEKYRPETGNSAHSLQTTAEDYAKFIREMFYPTLVRKATVKEMLRPHVGVYPKEVSPDADLFWGLGWGLQETPQGSAFWHWGDNGTFKCFVIAYPRQKLGLVYFTNSENGLSITGELLEQALGGEFPAVDWIGYPAYDAPGRMLMKALMHAEDIAAAAQPFMDPSGAHHDKNKISEWEVNRMGYRLMEMGKVPAAKTVLGWNLRAYPESANVYDSYAEACLRNGEPDQALKWYRQAYEKDPENVHARAVIAQLSGANRQGTVRFVLPGFGQAQCVGLAGQFNDWNPMRNICFREGDQWICQMDLAPGQYAYKFWVDGSWILDPENPQKLRDGDHENSVRIVQ